MKKVHEICIDATEGRTADCDELHRVVSKDGKETWALVVHEGRRDVNIYILLRASTEVFDIDHGIFMDPIVVTETIRTDSAEFNKTKVRNALRDMITAIDALNMMI